MARLSFFIVCGSAAIDQSSNRLSLFNVYESLAAPKFPISLHEVAAAALWIREEGDDNRDYQARILLSGCGLNQTIESANFRVTQARHRSLFIINYLKIDEPGELKFELSLNGENVGEHIITIVQDNSMPAEN